MPFGTMYKLDPLTSHSNTGRWRVHRPIYITSLFLSNEPKYMRVLQNLKFSNFLLQDGLTI